MFEISIKHAIKAQGQQHGRGSWWKGFREAQEPELEEQHLLA